MLGFETSFEVDYFKIYYRDAFDFYIKFSRDTFYLYTKSIKNPVQGFIRASCIIASFAANWNNFITTT